MAAEQHRISYQRALDGIVTKNTFLLTGVFIDMNITITHFSNVAEEFIVGKASPIGFLS